MNHAKLKTPFASDEPTWFSFVTDEPFDLQDSRSIAQYIKGWSFSYLRGSPRYHPCPRIYLGLLRCSSDKEKWQAKWKTNKHFAPLATPKSAVSESQLFQISCS
jgi:hypothetical protein